MQYNFFWLYLFLSCSQFTSSSVPMNPLLMVVIFFLYARSTIYGFYCWSNGYDAAGAVLVDGSSNDWYGCVGVGWLLVL